MLQVTRSSKINLTIDSEKIKVHKTKNISKQIIKVSTVILECTLIAIGAIDARKKYDWL